MVQQKRQPQQLVCTCQAWQQQRKRLWQAASWRLAAGQRVMMVLLPPSLSQHQARHLFWEVL